LTSKIYEFIRELEYTCVSTETGVAPSLWQGITGWMISALTIVFSVLHSAWTDSDAHRAFCSMNIWASFLGGKASVA
jgi:hypothetical protein